LKQSQLYLSVTEFSLQAASSKQQAEIANPEVEKTKSHHGFRSAKETEYQSIIGY